MPANYIIGDPVYRVTFSATFRRTEKSLRRRWYSIVLDGSNTIADTLRIANGLIQSDEIAYDLQGGTIETHSFCITTIGEE